MAAFDAIAAMNLMSVFDRLAVQYLMMAQHLVADLAEPVVEIELGTIEHESHFHCVLAAVVAENG